jgi:hypothetical protein
MVRAERLKAVLIGILRPGQDINAIGIHVKKWYIISGLNLIFSHRRRQRATFASSSMRS